jgi:hypothetical protein
MYNEYCVVCKKQGKIKKSEFFENNNGYCKDHRPKPNVKNKINELKKILNKKEERRKNLNNILYFKSYYLKKNCQNF